MQTAGTAVAFIERTEIGEAKTRFRSSVREPIRHPNGPIESIRDIHAARRESGRPAISFEFPPKTDEGVCALHAARGRSLEGDAAPGRRGDLVRVAGARPAVAKARSGEAGREPGAQVVRRDPACLAPCRNKGISRTPRIELDFACGGRGGAPGQPRDGCCVARVRLVCLFARIVLMSGLRP